MLIVVVVPFTVRSPPTVRSCAIETLFGRPIVTVCPEIVVSTSFAVPLIVSA